MRTRTSAVVLSALVAALVAFAPCEARAQGAGDFTSRCASWIAKKGYSRDYIAQRTGTYPPLRTRWHDNIRAEELRPGDVVVETIWPGHVAIVESVERDAAGKPVRLEVTSFNHGDGRGWIDRDCEVTKTFGVATNHWITMAETDGYWRPPPRVR